MSAKNITTEKIDSSGFSSGGYKAPMGAGGGTKTPKGAVLDDRDTADTAFPKGVVGKGKMAPLARRYKSDTNVGG
jgi:hypothetical protein